MLGKFGYIQAALTNQEVTVAKKPEPEPLALDEIVRNVASQLHKLRDNPPPEPVIELSECEIELAVKASATVGGGLKFYIFSAQGSASDEQSSRIKLTFKATEGSVVLLARSKGDRKKPVRQQ